MGRSSYVDEVLELPMQVLELLIHKALPFGLQHLDLQ